MSDKGEIVVMWGSADMTSHFSSRLSEQQGRVQVTAVYAFQPAEQRDCFLVGPSLIEQLACSVQGFLVAVVHS